ncbi:response regulator [Pigmentiphaga aceris]|uniref:histidine kinase n=1 Tax=Pigmentiphaga aceris TaxID=1940612 RepID=A0A5C0AYH6_9BURK|nr:response regulator [Pigmentiphaga aceris]QEI05611.1 response regulator [Pigmentiphaga aceris]
MNTLPDFESLLNASPNAYMLMSADLTMIWANDAYVKTTSTAREAFIGRNVFDAFPNESNESINAGVLQLRASFDRVLKTGLPDTVAVVSYRVPADAPHTTDWSATHTPLLGPDGRVAYVLQCTVEVSELQRLKLAARRANDSEDPDVLRSDELRADQVRAGLLDRAHAVQSANLVLEMERTRLRNLFDQTPGFMAFLSGPTHVFELANRAYFETVGRHDIIGRTVREALPEIAVQGYIELLDRVYRTGEAYVGRGMRALLERTPDEALDELYIDFVFQPVFDLKSQVIGIFVQGSDVTAEHKAQSELANYRNHLEELVAQRTDELRESQAALLQAQKMEAVGKLTGGVAHDFNNVLQIISGNLHLLQAALPQETMTTRRLASASAAVERGAKLSSQLLSFARRQPLDPRVVNPGRLVRNMDELLRHALGEHISIETIIAGGLWNTFVDPHHLENVILNLAINARDAMGGEGRLTIEAGNAMLDDRYAQLHPEVTAGQYVMLAVTDTGMGMSEHVMSRAFEPFFTTKPEGLGTGLGLSMAYGFVKQSGGHIKIYTEPQLGTSIKIYLPRSHLNEAALQAPAAGEAPVTGGRETILVVEDDEHVRATAVDMLLQFGYQVLKASDAQSALVVLQSGVHIDLMFTDVVMPGPIRSPELARQALTLIPDLEILFTSGYTENAIVHGGRLDPGVTLLSKPYRMDDLARKVRHLFRNRAQRKRSSQVADVPPAPAAAPAAVARPSGLRILLVEDNADTRVSTAELLGMLGHTVVAVEDAEAALEVLNKQAFDLLFSDISLPNMSGADLALEAVSRFPSMRVIFASGYGETGGLIGGKMDSVTLVKPYSLEELMRAVSHSSS